MTTVSNNKANVSTTRGVSGGYLFSAPVGTTGAPTRTTYKTWASSIPAGWGNLGYIPEDGFTESVDMDSGEVFRDLNQDPVEQGDGPATESVTVGLMEVAKNALATQYGHDNVTDDAGTIEVKHNWSKSGEHYQYVFLLLLKNGRKWVKYIPDGKVTGLSDLTGNKTTIAQREVTITYLTDDDGNGCFDWIESNETSAASNP